MSTRSRWFNYISVAGFERSQAITCKTCKGACFLWKLIQTPRRWNPEFKNKRARWFQHHDAKFKRVREDTKYSRNSPRRSRYRA